MSLRTLLVFHGKASSPLNGGGTHPAFSWHCVSPNSLVALPMSSSLSKGRHSMLKKFFFEWFGMDERFIMHRYISTRWAVGVGVILMFLLINYDYFVNDTLRIDLLMILLAMLITKVVVMVYYRLTH
jgi:hypothetical protein